MFLFEMWTAFFFLLAFCVRRWETENGFFLRIVYCEIYIWFASRNSESVSLELSHFFFKMRLRRNTLRNTFLFVIVCTLSKSIESKENTCEGIADRVDCSSGVVNLTKQSCLNRGYVNTSRVRCNLSRF